MFARLPLVLTLSAALVAVHASSSSAQTPAQAGSAPSARPAATPAWLEGYREPAARLIGAAMVDQFAWRRLATLTDGIGARLSVPSDHRSLPHFANACSTTGAAPR